MPVEIEGLVFSGFPGRDSVNLRGLSYAGRVQWLKYRFELVFLTPFRELVRLEDADRYVWLCVVSLLCSAIEALASFEFQPGQRRPFVAFVEKYFSAAFTQSTLRLHDPRPTGWTARTPAEHLYKYFRSGLAHSFCIEWGGILHREDGAPDYLFEAKTGHGLRRSLGVIPRELVADFETAVERFFQVLATPRRTHIAIQAFTRRFEVVFLAKTGPPLP